MLIRGEFSRGVILASPGKRVGPQDAMAEDRWLMAVDRVFLFAHAINYGI
jgi:hypothetical protein